MAPIFTDSGLVLGKGFHWSRLWDSNYSLIIIYGVPGETLPRAVLAVMDDFGNLVEVSKCG